MGRKERRERGFLTLFPPKRWEIGRTYFSYKRYPFAKNYRHSCVQSFGAPTDEISPLRFSFVAALVIDLFNCLIKARKKDSSLVVELLTRKYISSLFFVPLFFFLFWRLLFEKFLLEGSLLCFLRNERKSV